MIPGKITKNETESNKKPCSSDCLYHLPVKCAEHISLHSNRFASSPEQDASYIFSFQQVSFIPDPG